MARPKAYSYIRMSTESQLKGDSLRRQTELSQRYAATNNLELVDDSSLHDIGVSAFKGVNLATGALGRFLDALKAGKVPAGSYLLVESLDRLSRDRVTSAMTLFLSILEAGVNIVTLSDNQVYLSGKTETMQLLQSLFIMSRANEESQIKSQRVTAAWDAKRRAIGERKLTTMAPAWLNLSPDRRSFVPVEAHVAVVQRIFALATDGLGVMSITKTLNKDGIPPFGRSNGWNESYVEKILKSRAVLGEFQPHVKSAGGRVASGEPIKGYYPAVVDEDVFLSVQAARRARGHSSGGRRGANTANLFGHLATCGYCGQPMRVINKGAGKGGGRYFKCSSAAKGLSCSPKGWRYSDFETSFLFFVQELDLAEMLKTAAERSAEGQRATKLLAERERLREIELLRDRSYELLLAAGDNAYVAKKLAEYEEQIAVVAGRINELTAAEFSQPLVTSQTALLDQIKLVSSTLSPDAGPVRARLATRLKEMIAELRVEVEGSRPRLAETRAFLEGSEPDEAYRNQIIQTLQAVAKRSGSENPTFQVVFVNGVQRRVVVDTEDPTKFKSEVYVSGSERLVRRPGENDWHANTPLSEPEMDDILAAAKPEQQVVAGRNSVVARRPRRT